MLMPFKAGNFGQFLFLMIVPSKSIFLVTTGFPGKRDFFQGSLHALVEEEM